MTRLLGFDREKYIEMQSEHIHERRQAIGGKLYLEMGGKLFDDMHASRVLPGFTPDNKIAMLERIKDDVEILICINAKDIERQRCALTSGILYEDDVFALGRRLPWPWLPSKQHRHDPAGGWQQPS
ncbi:Uncharacterized protein conserved in bacteria [Corynebacterium striatum]|nr:DUF1846 domain-containing protein [Corynebacterium striatum]STE01720.1 Uncharacterized protein conserved in bacteria [Corynebacterium striatum]